MQESGNNDLGFAKANCSYHKGLCGGMRYLHSMNFLTNAAITIILVSLLAIHLCYLYFPETYTMSGINRLCSHHLRAVTDEEECKKAAKMMAYVFIEPRNRTTFPPGCYFLNENENIYFNTYGKSPFGRISKDAEQVCKSKG